MKRTPWILPACLAGLLSGGCVHAPVMLPVEYFTPPRSISVQVVHCSDAPVLRTDQPVGNTTGIGWMSRNETMRSRLARIAPKQIELAVEKELMIQLAPEFPIAGGGAQLVLEVSIDEWGWYVPIGRFGDASGPHHFRIRGSTTITDPARDDGVVFYSSNCTDSPLDNHQSQEACEAALPEAAEDFAAQVVRSLLQGRPH
jgi:hypothetical protein